MLAISATNMNLEWACSDTCNITGSALNVMVSLQSVILFRRLSNEKQAITGVITEQFECEGNISRYEHGIQQQTKDQRHLFCLLLYSEKP